MSILNSKFGLIYSQLKVWFGKKELEIPNIEILPGIFLVMPVSSNFDTNFRTNCIVIGTPGEEALIIDPSPFNDTEYKNFLSIIIRIGKTNSFKFSYIVITHSHGDHHKNAPRFAKELSIPLIMSQYTLERITKKKGINYFDGNVIHIVNDGDDINIGKGNFIKVYNIPGHDEGQIGLAPENMQWFIVGDLIESNRTVVIGGEEGNMTKYFHSLERVIALSPQWIIPSHGSPLKSVDFLVKTLTHRRERENQVKNLFLEGQTPEEIVKSIYRGTDKRLWPLALENVKAHLKKLKDEGSVKFE